jgi:hypothetical protein
MLPQSPPAAFLRECTSNPSNHPPHTSLFAGRVEANYTPSIQPKSPLAVFHYFCVCWNTVHTHQCLSCHLDCLLFRKPLLVSTEVEALDASIQQLKEVHHGRVPNCSKQADWLPHLLLALLHTNAQISLPFTSTTFCYLCTSSNAVHTLSINRNCFDIILFNFIHSMY